MGPSGVVDITVYVPKSSVMTAREVAVWVVGVDGDRYNIQTDNHRAMIA